MPVAFPAVLLVLGLVTSEYWMLTICVLLILVEFVIHGQHGATVGITHLVDRMTNHKNVRYPRWFSRPASSAASANACAPFAMPGNRKTGPSPRSGMPSGFATWVGAASIIALLVGFGKMEADGRDKDDSKAIVAYIAVGLFAAWLIGSRLISKCGSVPQVAVGLVSGLLIGYSLFTMTAAYVDPALTNLPAPAELKNPTGWHHGLMVGGLGYTAAMTVFSAVRMMR